MSSHEGPTSPESQDPSAGPAGAQGPSGPPHSAGHASHGEQGPHSGPGHPGYRSGPGPDGAPGGSRSQGSRSGGFFASLRHSGLVRTDQRWVGGVAGGVALRLGIDPIVVRCVWVVISVFSGIGLVLYGLGWALLPEESDGRIHVEEAIAGRVNAALAGAIGAMLVGLSLFDGGLVPRWYAEAWGLPAFGGILWGLFWVGLLILVVMSCLSYADRRRGRPRPSPMAGSSAPSGTAPGGPGGVGAPSTWQRSAASSAGGPGAPAGPTGPGTPFRPGMPAGPAGAGTPFRPGMPAGPGGPSGPGWHGAPIQPGGPGAWQHGAPGAPPLHRAAPYQPAPPRPVPPRRRAPRRGPGRGLSLAIMGLALVTLAGCFLAIDLGRVTAASGMLIALGGLTALLGAGVLLSALRRRRGGWMSGFGVLALMMALPALAIGPYVTGPTMTTAGDVTYAWQDIADQGADSRGTVTLVRHGIGNVVLDLRDMPGPQEASQEASAAPVPRVVELELGAGNLTILTRAGQAVRVDARNGVGALSADLVSPWSDASGTTIGRSGAEGDYTVAGEEVHRYQQDTGGVGRTLTLDSPAARESGPAITIRTQVGTGDVNISERPAEITWSGSAEGPTWVVDTWTDAQGERQDPAEQWPVPGMEHPAVTSQTAQSCLEGLSFPDDIPDPTWRDVGELSSQEQQAYQDCLSRAWQETGGRTAPEDGTPEASASPSATAEPTASPSAQSTSTN